MVLIPARNGWFIADGGLRSSKRALQRRVRPAFCTSQKHFWYAHQLVVLQNSYSEGLPTNIHIHDRGLAGFDSYSLVPFVWCLTCSYDLFAELMCSAWVCKKFWGLTVGRGATTEYMPIVLQMLATLSLWLAA